MLLITKRKKVGSICGHSIYTITESQMIPIPNSPAESNMDSSKSENRSYVNTSCKSRKDMVVYETSNMLKYNDELYFTR